MDANDTAWALKALLDWQAELGADAAIAETPQDRYGEVAAAPVPSAGAASTIVTPRPGRAALIDTATAMPT